MVFRARMQFFEISFKHLDLKFYAGLNKLQNSCTLTAQQQILFGLNFFSPATINYPVHKPYILSLEIDEGEGRGIY